MQDKARVQTDKILNTIESRIKKLYSNDSALNFAIKRMNKYMHKVQLKTQDKYEAYKEETDVKKKSELKKEYSDAVRELTINSKEYNKLKKNLVKSLSDVNEKSLDIVNSEVDDIYVMNYNQVAEECKKVGIKVNG